MKTWIMDPNVFGFPDYGQRITTSRTFASTFGDIGRSYYRSYNPTGPLPVSVRYEWKGDVYAMFREAWETKTILNFGANWFQISLVAPIPFAEVATRISQYERSYNAHFIEPFSASLAGYNYWSISFRIDLDITKENQ